MSKDGSAGIYLASEELVRGKFIVSLALPRRGDSSLFSSFSPALAPMDEERCPFHKFISAVKRERTK